MKKQKPNNTHSLYTTLTTCGYIYLASLITVTLANVIGIKPTFFVIYSLGLLLLGGFCIGARHKRGIIKD